MTTTRRTFLGGAAGALALPGIVRAQESPGVTATELRIGTTYALSGPASAYSLIPKCLTAMFKRLNEQGGIAGRQVTFLVYDDAYSLPKSLEEAPPPVDYAQAPLVAITL